LPQFCPVRKKNTCTQAMPALGMQGKDIGFFDGCAVDALMALDLAERRHAVAIDAARSKSRSSSRSCICCGQLRLHLPGFARQERLGFVDQPRIVLGIDLAGAGAGAALDLVEQAGPGAAFIDAVGAGADEETPAAAH
jgi:hypothetical protein